MLKEYNKLQIEVIKECVKKSGKDPENQTDVNNFVIHVWIHYGFNVRFREVWERKEKRFHVK